MRTILVMAVVAGLTGCAASEKPAASAPAGAAAKVSVNAPAKRGEKYEGQAVSANRLGAGDYLGSDLRTPQVHRIETAALPQD